MKLSTPGVCLFAMSFILFLARFVTGAALLGVLGVAIELLWAVFTDRSESSVP